MSAGTVNLLLGLVAGIVVVSVVVGAVDLVRQPGWAWRAAGEPKALCLLLVLLLPGVGLAIYVFGARPKVVAVAEHGRAANLPFERFGDREALADESVRAAHALALPTAIGSFGEVRAVRTVRAVEPGMALPGARFTDAPAGVATASGEATDPAGAVATTTAPDAIRIPGGLGRPYRPKQRTSFAESETMHTVAAQILGATGDTGTPGGEAPPTPGNGTEPPAPVFSMAGTAPAAATAAPGGGRAAGGAGALPTLGIPLATPSAPELSPPAAPGRRPPGARAVGGGTRNHAHRPVDAGPDLPPPIPLLGRRQLDAERLRRRRRVARPGDRLTVRAPTAGSAALGPQAAEAGHQHLDHQLPGQAGRARRSRSASASRWIARAIRRCPAGWPGPRPCGPGTHSSWRAPRRPARPT